MKNLTVKIFVGLFVVATVLTVWSGISYVVKNRAVLRDTAH